MVISYIPGSDYVSVPNLHECSNSNKVVRLTQIGIRPTQIAMAELKLRLKERELRF